PAGGFFLWLDVAAAGGSEAAALKLFREAGVRVLPGRYIARDQADGSNPGADYIRVAMVQDHATTAEALHRLVAVLGQDPQMPTIHRTFDADGFLPDDLGAAIRRRLREITGIGLIAFAALAACALATWSIKDPSLSFAASAPVRNLLGKPGAIAADLLTQL